MIIHRMPQGSDEWLKVRMGKFTASTAADMFAKPTTATYNNLINRVVFERLTGEAPETFKSAYMERGNELEAEARTAYELITFNNVEQVGFLEADEWYGVSPDGLIDLDGGLEIKCPSYSTIISYMLSGTIPSDYMMQMQMQMAVSGRDWCDFFCYHPKLKPILKRVPRDEKMIVQIETQLGIVVEEAMHRIEVLTRQTR